MLKLQIGIASPLRIPVPVTSLLYTAHDHFIYFYCPNTGQCPVLLELKAITYMEEHRARALYFVSTTVHLHTPVERLRVRSH